MSRAWLLVLPLLASCAVPVPPSGGPEDKEPPRITATVPSGGSTGVDPSTAIEIEFSEKMKRERMERLLKTYPPIEPGKVEWHKKSVTIQPARPLAEDTTYVVEILPGYRDEHNVANREGYRFAFSTGAAIDSGTISGEVYFRRKASKEARVRLFSLPVDSTFRFEASRPNREVGTDEEGGFVFANLPTADARFVLWAYQDANGNRSYDSGKEYGESYADTILLSESEPSFSGVRIYIVDPREPGKILGTVANRTGIDTMPVSVALYTRKDTLREIAGYTICNPEGRFEFSEILKGSYWVEAFIDFSPDSLCSTYPCPGDTLSLCDEPCAAYPDSVRVEPGGRVELEPIVLEKKDEDRFREDERRR